MSRRTIASILVAVCLVAAVMLPVRATTMGQNKGEYVSSTYMEGPKELTIKTLEGKLLSVLSVPADVELSLHVVREAGPAKESSSVSGDIIVRVLPRSHLREGLLLPQMMEAPFALELNRVEVAVK